MLDGLLDGMRDTVERTLGPSTVEVKRQTRTRTGTGGSSFTWSRTYLGPARVGHLSQTEARFVEGLREGGEYGMTVEYDADIRMHDHAFIDGAEYEVTSVIVNSLSAGRRVVLKAL